MSWVTGIDWSSVVPASVVTSTAVTLLLRYFDRNRPNLVLTRREVVLRTCQVIAICMASH